MLTICLLAVVNVKACYVTGYAVLGATAISTAVLAYFY